MPRSQPLPPFRSPSLPMRVTMRVTLRVTFLCLASCLAVGLWISSGVFARLAAASPGLHSGSHSSEAIEPDAATLLETLAQADVVYLGELHDRAYDHQAQLSIIQALAERNPKLAIAMEMFQRPFQNVLDAYLAGDIDETALVEQTEYETRWAYPWELYAPILRWAREAGVPVIAANTPQELTRKVATGGLAALEGDDFRYVPPVSEIDLGDRADRSALEQLFEMHMQFRSPASEAGAAQADGAGESGESGAIIESDEPNTGFDRFFAAQVLWDETMAEAIAAAHLADPNRQIVLLAGRGHIAYGFGIPNRVQRRVRGLTHVSVFFAQTEADREPLWPLPDLVDRPQADYFWSF